MTAAANPTLPTAAPGSEFPSGQPTQSVESVAIPEPFSATSESIVPPETIADGNINPASIPIDNSTRSEPIVEVSMTGIELDTQITTLEEALSREFINYFKHPSHFNLLSLDQIRQVLRKTEEEMGMRTAVVYIVFGRTQLNDNAALVCPSGEHNQERDRDRFVRSDRILQEELGWPCDRHPDDPVELVVVTALEKPLRLKIPEAHRQVVEQLAVEFRHKITDRKRSYSQLYLEPSQELYRLLIEPIQPTLERRRIQNLIFVPDEGLRSLPFAALHDGEQFLVEQYSLAIVPSFSLTQPTYTNLKNEQVLAMGASEFEELTPLPAVPLELDAIVCGDRASSSSCWSGKQFLNEEFTLNTLKKEVDSKEFSIVHLATHMDFQPGSAENSYIQLWDGRLRLSDMKDLQWQVAGVDLLVFSSCRSAIGDREAELGFAGLALQSGARSAIASLWYVSDNATLGLMSELYDNLRSAPIRAEALRQAQLQFIRGNVRLEAGQLMLSEGAIALPKQQDVREIKPLSHPYYWAGFTTIGNPW
jgi:CHAT domain-containing protein